MHFKNNASSDHRDPIWFPKAYNSSRGCLKLLLLHNTIRYVLYYCYYNEYQHHYHYYHFTEVRWCEPVRVIPARVKVLKVYIYMRGSCLERNDSSFNHCSNIHYECDLLKMLSSVLSTLKLQYIMHRNALEA